MTEVIDDTETFTIALTPPPCPTPSLAYTVTGIDGLTVHVNVTACDPGSGAAWKSFAPTIQGEDDNAIENVRVGTYDYTFRNSGTYELYLIGSNNCGKSTSARRTVTVAAPVITAKGDIVSLNYPASVQQGALYDIRAMAKNIGGSSGTFKMQLIINGAVKSTSAQFTLVAGATSTDKIPAATAPMTGTSMSFAVKCIRIT